MKRYFGKIEHEQWAGHLSWKLFDIETHVCIKLKNIFLQIGKYHVDPFRIVDNPEVCRDLHWFFQRYPFQFVNPKDENWFIAQKDAHIQMLDDLDTIVTPDYKPRKIKAKGELREYQAKAVEILMKRKFLMVGDVVGLGKTYIGIGMLLSPGTLPGIVVVQTHLNKQWQYMIENFCDFTVHQIKVTKPYSLPKADVYIIKYSCLLGWVDIFKSGFFKSVCFDEIQNLRRSESARYHAAKILSNNSEYKLGLSATPIFNYGNEMWNILNLLKEHCLGSFQDFTREWAPNGKLVTNAKALGSYLSENFYFMRRTRDEVGMELPPVNKIVHYVGFDQTAVDKIEKLAIQLATTVCSGTFVERGKAARELDIMVRQATGVSKARYVAEYVNMLAENGESVLLAGWHRECYKIWNERILAHFKPVMYTGSESPRQKEISAQKFISGESKVMIMSLRSGVGLDGLQLASSLVVYGELDWSPQVHEQFTGRLARDGQTEQVTAIYLVSESGSDPLMIDLLGLKASQSREIIDPLKPFDKIHSDERRVKLLAEEFLKKRGIKIEKKVEPDVVINDDDKRIIEFPSPQLTLPIFETGIK